MEINKDKLFEAIEQLDKEELIQLLDDAFINMKESIKREVFGSIYKAHTKNERTPATLLTDIKNFYRKSINGYYYAPFNINSKNFSHIPEETEDWFDEVSSYLDFTSELVMEEQYESAKSCFKILFELIEKMNDGEAIVFADEVGDWMIHAEKDHHENYIIALTHTTKTVEEYVETLIPLLKEDSYFSFSNKVYQKVKRHATAEQLAAIEKAIKEKSIKTS